MNYDYRRTARDHNLTIDKVAGDDLSRFPIEKARYRSIWHHVINSNVCIAGYGWTLQTRTVRPSLRFLFSSFPFLLHLTLTNHPSPSPCPCFCNS